MQAQDGPHLGTWVTGMREVEKVKTASLAALGGECPSSTLGKNSSVGQLESNAIF